MDFKEMEKAFIETELNKEEMEIPSDPNELAEAILKSFDKYATQPTLTSFSKAAEEETDLLSSDGGTVGAKASAAVNAAAKRAKDDAYREEETDVLSYGGNRTAADEGDETDVLMSGTSVPQDEEIVGRYSAEETAVLRSIHVSADEPKTDSKKIVTLYSETIVHTEESL